MPLVTENVSIRTARAGSSSATYLCHHFPPIRWEDTLTEKLLLYVGAVHLAGAVEARRHQRQATSDWMELEQAREIDCLGARVHSSTRPAIKNFSEDTCRTLMAADSTVMVLDSAKGIEPQIKKPFAVRQESDMVTA